MTSGIRRNVKDLLKALPEEGTPQFKLAVIDCVPDEVAGTVTAFGLNVVQALKKASGGRAEVNTQFVAKATLHPCGICERESLFPCDVNDPKSPRYEPDDAFLNIKESLTHCTAALFVVTAAEGGLNAAAQRLFERFRCARKSRPKGKRMVERVVAAVAIGGDKYALRPVEALVLLHLSKLGFILPSPAAICIGSDPWKLDELATNLVSVANCLRR